MDNKSFYLLIELEKMTWIVIDKIFVKETQTHTLNLISEIWNYQAYKHWQTNFCIGYGFTANLNAGLYYNKKKTENKRVGLEIL